jgi:hypothetical protein
LSISFLSLHPSFGALKKLFPVFYRYINNILAKMSLNALQKAEKRNCDLLDANAKLRKDVAMFAAEKDTAVRQLAQARRKLDRVRRDSLKKLVEKDDLKAKMLE